MRVFVAGLLLATAVAGAVAMNGYRASATERSCAYLRHPGEACSQAAARLSSFKVYGADRSGFYSSTRSWKPGWVLPASIFLAIAGAGAAAAVAASAPLRVRS